MVYSAVDLDATFHALADPTRRDILARLSVGDRGIAELAACFDMSLPAVSKHIRVLQAAGLATVERHGRVRRATLTPVPMRQALAWMERYRRFWESELDRLAAYLEHPETVCPTPSSLPTSSKSAGPSAHRASVSSTRGRKPKQSKRGTRRGR